MLRRIIALVAVAVLLNSGISRLSAQDKQPPFTLTIIHTNDQDEHHDAQRNGGGDARAAGIVKQIRGDARNTLLLDAGGRLTGTLYNRQYQGQDNVQIMNMMAYQAMTLGNHEFDDGESALSNFVDAVNFPVVTANVDFSASKQLAGKVKPFVIIQIAGQKIGIIGLTTADTPRLSAPGKELFFKADYAGVVQPIVDKLRGQGVNKIILLTHIGYAEDLKLAGNVSGVAAIVGGHSHTLLNNVLKDGVSSSYPTMTKSKSGDLVAVVQAGANSQFVGRLDLQFDAKGVVTQASGDTIPVTRYISPDPDIDTAVTRLALPLSDVGKRSIQNAKNETITAIVALPSKPCLSDECPLGDLVADAIRQQTGAQIGIVNGGGLGADLPLGTVSINTILAILPFDQTVSTFKLRGADLTAALENGVSQAGSDSSRFPQVSGLRFKYDGSKPAGSRIVSVEIVSTGKGVSFTPIDPAAVYNVTATNFIRQGGDGFSVLTTNAIDAYDFGSPIYDVVIDYLAANGPIPTKQQGRITHQDKH